MFPPLLPHADSRFTGFDIAVLFGTGRRQRWVCPAEMGLSKDVTIDSIMTEQTGT